MYPSLIIENNICFTTVSPEGTIESPTGARFLSADKKKGLLPAILASLMVDRQEVRQKMKEATDSQMKEFYDGLQAAIKVLMNAFYGVLASSFYRFNNPEVGASITAFARSTIQGIIGQLEKDEVKVVYADTDSVFFQSPHLGREASLDYARKTADRFSHGRISMEVDKIYETLFSHGRKKRYAGKVAWPAELAGQLVVRGYEIRRTDAFDLQSEAQYAVLDKILNNDVEGAVNYAKAIVREIQSGTLNPLAHGKDGYEFLVISRTVKSTVTKDMLEDTRWMDDAAAEEAERKKRRKLAKNVDEPDESKPRGGYINPKSLTNISAAQKLVEMGEEFAPGMKVSWIVTNSKESPMDVEPFVSGRAFEKKPDWEYYARRVAQSLSYVTEVYGWDERALLMGTVQADLFHEGFEPEEKPKKVEVQKTKKELTLEDFF